MDSSEQIIKSLLVKPLPLIALILQFRYSIESVQASTPLSFSFSLSQSLLALHEHYRTCREVCIRSLAL